MRPEWSGAELDRLRSVGDPGADALVAIDPRGISFQLFSIAHKRPVNGAPLPDLVKPPLRAFLDRSGALPAWADAGRIAHAQHLFGRYGMQLVVALLGASLPECYASVKGAQILALSPRLKSVVRHRILETAQFVLDVMAPDAFGPGGHGIRTAQVVRMVHALSRHHFLAHAAYDPSWGAPINAEDSLATLLAFCTVALQGLERLGVDFTDDEHEDYLHAWCVVGAFLGIDERLLPRSWKEGCELFDLIRVRHHGPSEAGRALTKALLAHFEELIPGTLFDGFAAVLMRRMVGETVAGYLDLPPEDWTSFLFTAFQGANLVLDRIGDGSTLVAEGIETISRKLLEGSYRAAGGGETGRFHVPGDLGAAWGIAAIPED